MAYQIQIASSALKSLSAMPRNIQRQIGRKIDALRGDPLPSGCKKLHTQKPLYRIRSGDYRIVYEIRNEEIIILILRIAHRREVYKNIDR